MSSIEYNNNILIVDNVSKSFLSIINRARILVIKNISLQAQPGEITALMGGNGSGKSTLLRMMAGLLKPSSGIIKIYGERSSARNIKQKIGFLPENPHFHRGVSGLDFLTYIGRIRGIKKPRLRAKVWLERFGINEKWQKLPTNLYSEGMRERTGLAAAFMPPDVSILLLDEPLENLDSEMKEITIKLILEAAKDENKIIVTAVHPDPDFDPVIDQKYFIKNGRIEA